MASRRSSRAPLAWVAAVVMVVMALPAAALAAPEDDLRAAQGRADRAADELAAAEEELARAQDAVAHTRTRVESIDARVGLARDQVRELAIRLYVDGTVPVIRILRMGDANEVIRAQQYSRVIAGASTDSLQQFRADREDLREEQAVLELEQEAHADSLENLRERRADAIEEIEQLSEVVAQATAARDAERRAEAAAAVASGSAPAPAAGTESPSSDRSATSTEPSPASAQTSELTATPEPQAPSGPAADWICPVQGPLAFSDDYGAPRGGGFSHQGNDILAPRGTPVVASVDGVVRHRSGAISGLAYYLDGDDGTEYFGAHLDSYGESGRVSAGTVVGTVGNTGDAASTAPHLHFEVHPGGGNINPFPILSQYC